MNSISGSGDWKKIRLKYAAPLRTDRMAGSADSDEYVGLENLQSWTGKFVPTENSEAD